VADTDARLYFNGANGGVGRRATELGAGIAPITQARFTANARWIVYTSIDGTIAMARNPYFTCRVDWDQSRTVGPSDVAAFVQTWSRGAADGTVAGDFDRNGVVEPADVSAFVNAWFAALGRPCNGGSDQ
jgi:hypothetical protein